ncbi:protein pelota [Linderina pennispora]|uniref:Protein pelota n=1 Tax=Linderina pennispora TaxID=61395 RepID=A0A1Y1WLZ2_9FUNG|nr:protein pelota [Linderina pennispora]ORX74587.1 protein pelota [Linderina pennispora]
MCLLKQNIEKDRSGTVRLIPEQPEDMWHLYNLIQKGDQLTATSVRGVKTETSTGSVSTDRVHVKLTISIEDIFFDNKYVGLGQYHTLDVEMNQQFTLAKGEWDMISLERIKDACDITKQADVAVVTMEEGLAVVCLLTQYMTVVRQRVEVAIPRKRKGSTTNYEKGVVRFYENVYRAIKQHIDFSVVKVVVIGSPGFAVKTDDKVIMENKKKFLLVHTSSGHKGAAAQEVKALDSFYQMLNNDPDRAFYGYDDVCKAAENGAIGTLLVTDELFRAAGYPDAPKDARLSNANVLVFSSLHVSGEQLNQLTGVAAILNFPLIIDSDIDE